MYTLREKEKVPFFPLSERIFSKWKVSASCPVDFNTLLRQVFIMKDCFLFCSFIFTEKKDLDYTVAS